MPDLRSFTIRPMTMTDIDQVMVVEHSAFEVPWSREAFENEMSSNQFASYFVADFEGKIIGYCGIWVIVDEAHITNLAVLSGYRGYKVGESLLRHVMLHALSQHAHSVSLEVRVSNQVAQNLYRKLGFRDGGIRKNYYSNNGEDALVMWVRL
jgi:ribosomal-protein-alanine N-acetyltransferase